MAIRKALAINPLLHDFEEVPSTDTVTDVSPSLLVLTNGEISQIDARQVVYLSAANTAKKAKADSTATLPAKAIAMENVLAGQIGSFQIFGISTGHTGLTTGAAYFVDPTTAGTITTTPPAQGSGNYLQKIGQAISTTEIELNFGPVIRRSNV